MKAISYTALSLVILSCLSPIASGAEEAQSSTIAPVTLDGKTLEVGHSTVNVPQYDFGAVAKGADVRRRFRFKNTAKGVVQFSSQVRRSSACCLDASLSKQALAPGEEAELEVQLDTLRFSHENSMTVVAMIEKPEYVEIRLPMKAYIRTDMVFTPGRVNFGEVDKGKSAERRIEIAYAGNPNWQILKAKPAFPGLSTNVVQTERANGRVKYDLVVKLDGKASAGKIDELITLVTDDKNAANVPLRVTGLVNAPSIKKIEACK